MRRILLTLGLLALALAATGTASAAQLIDRNATGVKIAANAKGEALLTYTKAGVGEARARLGRGQRARSERRTQAGRSSSLDYSGGWGSTTSLLEDASRTRAAQYDGPAIPNIVAACKAPDGCYWAAQSWQQPLPDLGFTPWTPAASQQLARGLALDGRPRAARGAARTGCTAAASRDLRPLHVRRPAGLRLRHDARRRADGQLRPPDLPRHATTRRTGRAGGARTPSSRTTRPACSVTASTRSTRRRAAISIRRARRGSAARARATSTALTASGPGVTPNVSAIIPGFHPFDASEP